MGEKKEDIKVNQPNTPLLVLGKKLLSTNNVLEECFSGFSAPSFLSS